MVGKTREGYVIEGKYTNLKRFWLRNPCRHPHELPVRLVSLKASQMEYLQAQRNKLKE
jgi:hypothetical protein